MDAFEKSRSPLLRSLRAMKHSLLKTGGRSVIALRAAHTARTLPISSLLSFFFLFSFPVHLASVSPQLFDRRR